MSDHTSWTPEELWDKADWEGGIAALIEYGGHQIFACLGEEVMGVARVVEENLKYLQAVFNRIEDSRTEVDDDF